METNSDALTITDRKVALRNIHVVGFVGTPPPPQHGVWERLDLWGYWGRGRPKELVIDGRSFRGRLMVLLPRDLHVGRLTGLKDNEDSRPQLERWAKTHTANLERFIEQGRFNRHACRQMILDIRQTTQARFLAGSGERQKSYMLSGLSLGAAETLSPFFLFSSRPRLTSAALRRSMSWFETWRRSRLKAEAPTRLS